MSHFPFQGYSLFNLMKKISTYSVKTILWFAAIFCSAWLLSANSLHNKFAFDDKSLIVENKILSHSLSLKEIFSSNYRAGAGFTGDGLYRPLVILSYAVNAHGAKPDPFSFHILNVTMNALNAVLFGVLVLLIIKNVPAAVASGFIFAFHPLHTEAVANIAGRPELLFVFFLFLAWIILEKYRARFFSIAAASIFLFAALLSKETAVMFPFILLGTDSILKRPMRNTFTIVKYFALGLTIVFYIIIRWMILGNTTAGLVPDFVDNPLYHAAPGERIFTACGVLYRYFMLLFFPVHLTADYSYNQIPILSSILHFKPIAGIGILAGITAVALHFRNRYPVYLIAVFLFFFPYILVSNILFPIGTIMGERLMYLPSAGLSLALGFLFSKYLKTLRIPVLVVFVLLLALFAVKTVVRNMAWYDDYTLFKTDLKNSPDSVKILCNLGYLTGKKETAQESMGYFRRALEILPDYEPALRGYGKRLYDQGKYEESAQYYARAVATSPQVADAHTDFGIVLEKLNRMDEAERELSLSVRINPMNPLPYEELSNVMIAKEEYGKAIECLNRASERGGNERIILNNMAIAQFLLGNITLAYQILLQAESRGISINQDLAQTIRAAVSRQ
ncbi:MAG: tetratricopeptide repeat protein [Candidatus Latescibacter sp.]|nr:tetratricopeptide repeat protein [Candidatus Latescibacter sp.]